MGVGLRSAVWHSPPGSGDWRSGSAAPLHGDGRRFESFIAYHSSWLKNGTAEILLAHTAIPVHKHVMKSRIVSAVLLLATAGFLFAQAEQVKGKAKDLKKKVEGQQTNQVDKANPPKK